MLKDQLNQKFNLMIGVPQIVLYSIKNQHGNWELGIGGVVLL